MTLIKDDLIQTLYDEPGFSKKKARTTVEPVFGLLRRTLDLGMTFSSAGSGSFPRQPKRLGPKVAIKNFRRTGMWAGCHEVIIRSKPTPPLPFFSSVSSVSK
jgi:nucleoid DNA-binding protein